MALIENKVEIDLEKAYITVKKIQQDVLVDIIKILRFKSVFPDVVDDIKRKYGLPDYY